MTGDVIHTTSSLSSNVSTEEIITGKEVQEEKIWRQCRGRVKWRSGEDAATLKRSRQRSNSLTAGRQPDREAARTRSAFQHQSPPEAQIHCRAQRRLLQVVFLSSLVGLLSHAQLKGNKRDAVCGLQTWVQVQSPTCGVVWSTEEAAGDAVT